MTEPPFGSTLSAGGFVALAKAGFRPLRQVQGTSIVSLGLQRRPASGLTGMAKPLRLESVAGVGASTTQVYYSRGGLAAQEFLNEGGWFELEERTSGAITTREHMRSRGCTPRRSMPARSPSSTCASAAAGSAASGT